MRFGLNSGPTTAGVLRGEKSRFQLFGDVSCVYVYLDQGAPFKLRDSNTHSRLTDRQIWRLEWTAMASATRFKSHKRHQSLFD
jgi:hypothetical protein